ncbi:hypothetical protein [Dethiobacter alkaliphilus]|uniref:DUF2007 domain-containing protein n=1 Tax=Dethiobacter alkaliphilus AHT 1 TaxID=555088 RepID=C0GH52_DETAL|nr:hypothetical protein [Dethiobacter alkaliphilus]EEG77354.1 hypothetical protein DealDRAFT_1811 [Dethiobacter alkaliphilus AHT 1]
MTYQDIENWVSIFEAATVDEAGIIKGMLEASKIPVVLDRETVNSPADLSEYEVVVKVPKEMAARAAQLLQATPYGVPEE